MKTIFLNLLMPRQDAIIYELPKGHKALLRLSEIGLREGMTITLKHRMPLKGPVIITVGQTQIALGHGMASKIKVKIKD